MSRDSLSRIVQISLFKEPPERVLKAAGLVNVFTGEIEREVTVGLWGKWICFVVGWEHPLTLGDHTEIIDLGSAILCPGFIEGHTHVDGLATLGEFLRYAIPGGATCIVTETAAIAAARGKEGILSFLKDAERQPLPIFVTAPPEVPPYPDFETCYPFSVSDFSHILGQESTVGMGEVYWGPLLDKDASLLEKVALTHQAGKVVEGHAAGARGDKLSAYCAAGISSCHESVSPEEVFEKRRCGMDVMIRCGYIRDDLKAIAPALKGKQTEGIMLVTDGFSPQMLVENGYLNHVARLAVGYGLDSIETVKMLSLHVARHFNLKGRGGIAPGWLADLIAVSDLKDFEVRLVMSEGKVLWKDGTFLIPPASSSYPESFGKSILIPEAQEIDFYLWAQTNPATVRAIRVKTETVTDLITCTLPLTNDGNIMADPSQDISKMAVIYRGATSFPGTIGFINGFGLKQGAVATSLSWDCNNVVVLGPNECDMAAAVNRIRTLGGGMVFSLGEEVVAEVPLPIAGLTSEKPLDELACEIREFEGTLREMGCPLSRPFLALQTLPFTGLPFYRLTDKGLLDIRKRELIPVVVE